MSTTLRSLATFLFGWLTANSALAEAPLPIKTGLWQITSQNEVDGKKIPNPSEGLANLPPEVRAKMQAMMKESGVSMDDSGGIKICHTRQTLESGALRGEDTRRSSSAAPHDPGSGTLSAHNPQPRSLTGKPSSTARRATP